MNPIRALMVAGLFGLWSMVQGAAAFGQSDASATTCERLSQRALPEATITMAQVVQPLQFKLPARQEVPGGPGGPGSQVGRAGGPPPGGGMNMALAPFNPHDTTNHVSFCRVAATLRPSGDSNIKIEVWLPLQGWNGKLMGAGDFGWAGSIMYGGLLYGLEHHFATVSTDTGHDNSQAMGEFALGSADRMIDYGYRAAHSMTVDAKVLIQTYYGRAPIHSYWYGCSLGGQMGLTEIQRFPEDYDAAIIGAPASPIVELNAYQIWPSLLVAQNPARMLGPEKAAMLHAAVMKACDAQDGAADGELEDPTSCHFDPKVLLCKAENNANCLTGPQVDFVQLLYKGPVNSRTGEQIFEGAAPGTEVGFGGYSADNAMGVAVALFKYMIFQDPNWDWKTLNMDKDIAYGRAVLRTINEADNPNLKPFFDRGGKILWYHGWLDGASPMQSVKYLDAVKRAVGEPVAQKSIRLFAMPGMGHCAGGTGCDTFDKIAVLDQWVESAAAPDTLVASKLQDGKAVRTHLICAYPKVARYSGSGDLNDAASFSCVSK